MDFRQFDWKRLLRILLPGGAAIWLFSLVVRLGLFPQDWPFRRALGLSFGSWLDLAAILVILGGGTLYWLDRSRNDEPEEGEERSAAPLREPVVNPAEAVAHLKDALGALMAEGSLAESESGAALRRAATRQVVSTLRRLDPESNGAIIEFLRAKQLLEKADPAVRFAQANLEGASFDGIDLGCLNFQEANLNGATFRDARLGGAVFRAAHLKDARFGEAFLKETDFRGAYMESADLEGCVLFGANLSGAYLIAAYLNGAFLKEAVLTGAFLDGAALRGTYLEGAQLNGASLREADLEGATFYQANLSGADFTNANLWGANLKSAVLTDAVLPDGSLFSDTTDLRVFTGNKR